jgi:hypothetical protein
MANPIGSIKVQIGGTTRVQNSSGTVNVQLGNQNASRVQAISYGQKQQLRNDIDVITLGVQDGDLLFYQANTDTFAFESPNAITLSDIDGGTF